MRRLAPAALLFACACSSAPAEPAPSQSGRRHHVAVNGDAIVLDFVQAHGNETIDLLTLNMLRNTNRNQAPIDLSPLARLKSVHTLSLSGFSVWIKGSGADDPPTLSPGFSDGQVESLGQIQTLRRLELRACRLTPGQRALLNSRLPRCEIREN